MTGKHATTFLGGLLGAILVAGPAAAFLFARNQIDAPRQYQGRVLIFPVVRSDYNGHLVVTDDAGQVPLAETLIFLGRSENVAVSFAVPPERGQWLNAALIDLDGNPVLEDGRPVVLRFRVP